jgi:hypothetical protein
MITMRDPELMLRAQRAATELERAWDRWRTMHGLGTEPLPPVTSYVGYSLEEPWGQPRVVFGIAAAEAEHLAALLDRHDCAGPVYAAMTSQNARPDANAGARGRGRGVRVPTQAPAGPAARDVSGPGPQGSRPDPFDPRTAGRLGVAEPEPAAGTDGLEDEPEGHDEGQPGLVAFRPRREPASSHGEVDETAQTEDPETEAAQAGRPSGGWTRRLPGGHSLPRQKRAGGAAKGASSKQQEGKDRADLTDLSAELAGWDAGELPGEASHRRVQRPPSRPDRPAL